MLTRDEAEEYTQALGQVVSGGWRQIFLGRRLGVPQALGLTTKEWVDGRLGGYLKLDQDERRAAVAELTEEGLSAPAIGEVLDVTEKTVDRDRAELAGTNVPAPSSNGAENPGEAGTNVPDLVAPIDEELLARQQRENLIQVLDRAVFALESPPSAAEAEVARLLVEGDPGPFTPDRFDRVVAYCTAFADALRKAGIDG